MTTVATESAPAAESDKADALTVEGVDVAYKVRGKDRMALRDVSFRIGRREAYGLVGESGSGKSTMALAVTRYLPRAGRVSAGSISIDGADVLAMRSGPLRELRAQKVSMVYQEPGRALNPTLRVGQQVAEVFRVAGTDRRNASDLAEEILGTVRIADPGDVMHRYPHQLSGGMLQRVVIAMALASRPSLLILDEPTTALDTTVEAEVLELISTLRSQFDTSILFISHNLAVIAEMCDRVGVLYAGELVEEASSAEIFEDPRHPYTAGLLRCIPRGGRGKATGRLDTIPGFLPPPGSVPAGCIFADRCGLAEDRCRTEVPPVYVTGPGRMSRCHFHDRVGELPPSESSTGRADAPSSHAPSSDGASVDVTPDAAETRREIVALRGVSKTFAARGLKIKALSNVDLTVSAGETLGIVGESGSGKTTLARVLLGLTEPDQGGVVEIDGRAVPPALDNRSHDQLRALQMVFQNPDSALNRRHTVRRLISRPLAKLAGLSGPALRRRLSELIAEVRMESRHLALKPAQLSGGLKQRVAIARAFAGDPRVVVCDEPTSALDVSVQAAILNVLVDLQLDEQVTYLFISHDLGVVRYLADRIAVLYLGKVMEVGPVDAVFDGPQHPYTEALLLAVPSIEQGAPTRVRLRGEVPSAADPPPGCVFHTRCPRRLATGVCETVEPPLVEVAPGRVMSCHIPIEELARLQSTRSN
jgi:peptide/nickel transport system ATP-binding protein